MSEANEGAYQVNPAPGNGAPSGGGTPGIPRLGHEVRFVLVGVGGGGVSIARAVARRRVRYLETVAINCDPRVQNLEEFDRRFYLGPDVGEARDTGGSPLVGGMLARAAEPALTTIFEGTPFVAIVASLGGGAGSGLVPHILELASRHCPYVSAFLVKPFQCEGDRRAVADRTIARIHLLEQFNDRLSHGRARLQILDNEALVARLSTRAFTTVLAHWGTMIGDDIEANFLTAAESEIDALTTARAIELASEALPVTIDPLEAAPESEVIPPLEAPPLPAAKVQEVELTFEVVGPTAPRPAS